MFKIFRFGLLSSIKFTKFSQNFKKLNEFTIFPFAKVGKKKQEKIQKEKSKESAQLSDEIDLSPIEEKMKLEVDTYKVL